MKCTTPYVYSCVRYEFGLVIICQCRFIDYNKYSTVVGILIVVDGGRGCACLGMVSENFVLSTQLFCEHKSTLENEVYGERERVALESKINQ